MLNTINLEHFVTEKILKKLFRELYPIPRSITGKGFIKSLNILGRIVDLNCVKVKTGTKVLDWTIPDEWNIKNAYVLNSKKKKLLILRKIIYM